MNSKRLLILLVAIAAVTANPPFPRRLQAKKPMPLTFKVMFYLENDETISGDINTVGILDASGPHSKGIYLTNCSDFDANSTALNEVFMKDGDNYLLPFRPLATHFIYTNTPFNGKYLSTTYKRNDNETIAVTMLFPAYVSRITTEDANTLKNALDLNRSNRRQYISDLKEECAKYAINAKSQCDLYDSLVKNSSDIDKQIQAAKDLIAATQEKVADESKKLLDSVSKINKFKETLSGHEAKLVENNSIIHGFSADIKNSLERIEDLKLEKGVIRVDYYKSLCVEDKENIKYYFGKSRLEAPYNADILNLAEKDILDNEDSKSSLKKLNTCLIWLE